MTSYEENKANQLKELLDKRIVQIKRDRTVLNFKENTEAISYSYNKEAKTVTPQLLVERTSGIYLEFIDTYNNDIDESNARDAAVISHCEDNGMIYKRWFRFSIEDEDTRSFQKIIFMEGPDNCGKSHIGRYLSHKMMIPYFRFSRQHDMWAKNQFKTALEFDQPVIAAMFDDMRLDALVDRSYASEFVYSSVFERETNMEVLQQLDERYSRLGAVFVILLRRDYSKNGGDIVVPDEKLVKLHDKYLEFVKWTKCSCVIMYVDDFGNDLLKQVPLLRRAINDTVGLKMKRDTEIEKPEEKKESAT